MHPARGTVIIIDGIKFTVIQPCLNYVLCEVGGKKVKLNYSKFRQYETR